MRTLLAELLRAAVSPVLVVADHLDPRPDPAWAADTRQRLVRDAQARLN